MSLKSELIVLLDNFADLLEFKGENPFKINAFRNGASILRSMENDLETAIKDGSIKSTKGLGKGLLSVIYEYFEKGFSSEYDNLVSEIPVGVLDLLNIRGLGAKKIKIIYSELGISSIEELEDACRTHKISSLKGFGPKTEETILGEISRLKETKNQALISAALNEAGIIMRDLSKMHSVKRVSLTGQVRRHMETVSQIELAVLADYSTGFTEELKAAFRLENEGDTELPGNIKRYIDTGVKLFLAHSDIYIPVHIYCTDKEDIFESMLLITTGSEEFIEKAGFQTIKSAETSEEGLFKSIGFPYIIPEMRESQFFDISGSLQDNSMLDISRFKGFFHFHTVFSDGKNTLKEMIKSGIEHGFEYFAVCDHSKAAFYANGLTEERVLIQKDEVSKTARELNTRIFHGIESDILKDGDLDYSPDFLSEFDIVVASVHSRFKMDEDEMTARIIKAVENPHTDILGHPTGRLLLARPPYKLNINKVIDACSQNKVAIEINANPHRLDLDWRNIYYAREKGCLFSINPDAHDTKGIDDINYGIKIARKGGIQPEEVINCFDLQSFELFLEGK